MRSAADLNVPKDHVLSIKFCLTWSHRQNSQGTMPRTIGLRLWKRGSFERMKSFSHLDWPPVQTLREPQGCHGGEPVVWLSHDEHKSSAKMKGLVIQSFFQVSSCMTLTNSIFKDSTDLHKTAVYCLPTKTPTSSYDQDKTTSEYAKIAKMRATPTIKLVLSEFYW